MRGERGRKEREESIRYKRNEEECWDARGKGSKGLRIKGIFWGRRGGTEGNRKGVRVEFYKPIKGLKGFKWGSQFPRPRGGLSRGILSGDALVCHHTLVPRDLRPYSRRPLRP